MTKIKMFSMATFFFKNYYYYFSFFRGQIQTAFKLKVKTTPEKEDLKIVFLISAFEI